jgi:hypothetical protein
LAQPQGFLQNQNDPAANARNLSSPNSWDDEGNFLPVDRLRQQYTGYLTSKSPEIQEQQQARQYRHGAQWTAEEMRILRKRRQPVVTYNRVDKKINAIVGLMERLRQDPKAFPRNPRNDEGAEVATQTIRYILDSNDWKTESSNVAGHAATDGISGMGFKLREGDKGDPDIKLEIVYGDDFFYDPRSYRPDFHDSRFLGMAKWVDEEECIELFPDLEDQIRSLVDNGSDLTTYSDREFKWVYTTERRVRLVEHWYKHKAKWHWCFYIAGTVLDQGVSPFFDDRGKTIPRFIMFSAAVDHDGDRYGFVRNLKGPQDEINQRRSKALFTTNSRRLIADKGAVDDVEKARSEWSRPDGYIEKNPKLDIHQDETTADLAGQFQFLEEAKKEIDQSAPSTPVMPGSEAMPKNTSGRAINLMQQAGTAELGPFILAYRGWKLRIYQAIWCCAQRYWTAERWIRVTDDQDMAKFIQLNGLDLDEWDRPQLVNYLGAMNVDILLDEGPDAVNMQADALDVIQTAMASGTAFPPALIIELLPIPNTLKKRALAMMQTPPDPVEQAGKVKYVQRIDAEIAEKNAGTLQRITQAAFNASRANLNAQEAEQAGFAQFAKDQSDRPYQPQPVQPTGPVQNAPSVVPQSNQQQLPLVFAKGLAGHPAIAAPRPPAQLPMPVPQGGYTAGLGLR